MLYPLLFKWLGDNKPECPLFHLPQCDGIITIELFKQSTHKSHSINIICVHYANANHIAIP